jgi:hypothetical protein
VPRCTQASQYASLSQIGFSASLNDRPRLSTFGLTFCLWPNTRPLTVGLHLTLREALTGAGKSRHRQARNGDEQGVDDDLRGEHVEPARVCNGPTTRKHGVEDHAKDGSG